MAILKRPSIVVVGSVNLDIVAAAERLPAAGETVTGATLGRYPGGKGANQALAARRLGAEVSLVACVGRDAEAEAALALLREDGVDLSACAVHETAATGVALIAVAAGGENQIVVAPGANRELRPVPLPVADALICQLEVPAETLAAITGAFRGSVCVNLAPAAPVPPALLDRADLIVVNETEAAWYGDRLHQCSALVVTTFGANGARICRDGAAVAEARPPAVTPIDTTGAGDAFTAALVVAIAEGQPLAAALRFACAAGAAASTRAGAQPSLPRREDVEHLLAAGPSRG